MRTEPKLKERLMLTDKGYKDMKAAIVSCTLTNISMMLPFSVMMIMIRELIKPLLGDMISWPRMWLLFGAGFLAAAIVFLCNKRDYKKTYVTSYNESENTRTSIAEHIRKLPMSVFSNKDLSEITTNFMGDAGTKEHVLSHVIPQLISNAISISLICIMLALFEWRLALATFITVPIAFAIIVLSRSVYGKFSERHVEAKLAASGQVQEYIEGIKVIRAYNMDGEKFTALETALRKMKRLSIRLELTIGIFVSGAQVVLQTGIGLVVLVGVMLLSGGQIDVIPLLMFVMIVVRIYGPIQTELTLLPELLYLQIAIQRMRDLMGLDPMEGDAQTPLADCNITFDDVSFRYNKEGPLTIEGMSTTMPAGTITALVGPSGSGKSTISRLIARFWDVDKGRITIGGRDVKTMDPEHLMSYMSFVFQDVILFNDTVYNNIRIGNLDASQEDIYAAARAACCDEFVRALPDGYHTMLGENGETLSGGERQRISIARALLKDAPIVLLDEATASLDPENEAFIQQAIASLIRGKTVIIIAHRLRTVEGADKILVLDKGRLVEEGRHADLMKRRGLYHRLYTIQQKTLGWTVGA